MIAYLAARILLFSLAWLPRPLSNFRARVFTFLLDLFVPKYRRVAKRNLELAGLEDRDRIVNGVFRSIARILVSFSKFPQIDRNNVHKWIRYEGLENFTQAQQKGRGVLIATGHFGNWELSAYAHALMTAPMHVVVRPLDNERLDAFVERYRALSGNHLIKKKEAAREILKALKAGDAVGILIDQNSSPEEGVFIDFFGRRACANAAFVKFAHHSKAAVIPGFALWSDAEKRYVLHFLPEIPMTGDIQADTQRIHSVLEQQIRKNPDQWLWIHRRWKTRPSGEPCLYD